MFSIVRKNQLLLILLMFFCLFPLSESTAEMSKEDKLIYTNAAGLSAITLWGVVNWDYFNRTMNTGNEGWFSDDTKHGGADKLGHFYTSYSTSRIFAYIFRSWGYPAEKGALFGSLSSFTMMSWMEIGDSFSHYGFSYEDFLMNSFGCLTGYCLAVNPDLSEKIDIRVEYLPDFKTSDVFTDYDNTKYLLALKLAGFEKIKNRLAKYLEFHIGYYTRDYPEKPGRKRRVFLGLGVNMSRIFNHYSLDRTAALSNYIQVPYTYLSAGRCLNK